MGCALLDPHGDLASAFSIGFHAWRLNDFVWLDPPTSVNVWI